MNNTLLFYFCPDLGYCYFSNSIQGALQGMVV